MKCIIEALHVGLSSLADYLNSCNKEPNTFNASALISHLDELLPSLQTHLANEPPALASLAKYDFDIRALADVTANHSMQSASIINLLPMLWFDLDVEFEDGMWKDFPSMASLVRWFMVNVLGWWRFGSYGADGKRVELLALREGYGC